MSLKICAAMGAVIISITVTSIKAQAQQEHDWRGTPWAEPQDTVMGTFKPDEYAWRLFIALNWPASSSSCGPDTGKKMGEPGIRVWEQWALKSDVFLPKAMTPEEWSVLCNGATVAKSLTPNSEKAAVRTQIAESKPVGMNFLPPDGEVTTAADEEVRMNEASFRFIRDNRLYDRDTLKSRAASGDTTLDFPLAAKEIKAHWVLLSNAADHSRYYTAKAPDGKIYGLVAFHIITKDMPRWFWATFEHADNENRWPAQYPEEFAGWGVPPRDAFACPQSPSPCNSAAKGLGLEGTPWMNYRLKATQTDWVTSLGEPTQVVNSKIESGFIQTKSSCISCHALAMVGAKSPSTMPFKIFKANEVDDNGRVANFVGVVRKEDRLPSPGTDLNDKFMQLDFVWSLRNAQSK